MFDAQATLYIAAISTAIVSSASLLIGTTVYDHQLTRRQQFITRRRSTTQLRRRPQVIVVVQARNASKNIEDCLNSLAAVRYRHCRIIVVDDGSTDNTADLVRQFQTTNPKRAVQLYRKRRTTSMSTVWNRLLYLSRDSELVFTMTATTTVQPDTITRAVNHYLVTGADSISPHSLVASSNSLVNATRQYAAVLVDACRKTSSLVLPAIHRPLGSPGLYTRQTLGDSTMPRRTVYYASDVVLVQNAHSLPAGPTSFIARCERASIHAVVAIVLGLAIFRVLQTALITGQSQLYGALWLTITILCASLVWWNPQLSQSLKWRLTGLLPLVFSLLYIGQIVRSTAVVVRSVVAVVVTAGVRHPVK